MGMVMIYDSEVWGKTDYAGKKVIGKVIQKEIVLLIKQPNKAKNIKTNQADEVGVYKSQAGNEISQ